MTTGISWCDETWNPITGCTPISEGCKNCYAQKMANRLKGRFGYPVEEPFRPGVLHADKTHKPVTWKKSRRVFVCSMGDLFHADVAWERQFTVAQIAGSIDRHKYLFLTKRPDNMMDFFNGDGGFHFRRQDWCKTWPLPHFWLGVTAENQKRADERIHILQQIPAAIKWVSFEPLLDSIDPYIWLIPSMVRGVDVDPIDWVVIGCESGPNRRECKIEWVESIVAQCKAASVPCFVKQLDINGQVEHDINKFPAHLRVREYPNA